MSWPHSVGIGLSQNKKGEVSRVFTFIILCLLQVQGDQLPQALATMIAHPHDGLYL